MTFIRLFLPFPLFFSGDQAKIAEMLLEVSFSFFQAARCGRKGGKEMDCMEQISGVRNIPLFFFSSASPG